MAHGSLFGPHSPYLRVCASDGANDPDGVARRLSIWRHPMRSWIRSLSARRPSRPGLSFRPTVEVLEDRRVLSGNVLQTNLVSDLPNVAAVQDKNLVNPWGISESPGSTGSPFWISDNNAGVSTLYSVPGANNTPVSINSLVVSIPSPGDPLGNSGTPTGTVFNLDG